MTRPCGTAAPFFLLFSQKREKKKRAAKTKCSAGFGRPTLQTNKEYFGSFGELPTNFQ
ncbi:MAG TPA: hypothetical protein VIU35_10285 [Chitinophagaceae bacterium]